MPDKKYPQWSTTADPGAPVEFTTDKFKAAVDKMRKEPAKHPLEAMGVQHRSFWEAQGIEIPEGVEWCAVLGDEPCNA
jgi:hypothetical protein